MKPGSFIVIDDEPCKVMTTDVSKPGKHGSAKIRIVAVGLFDNKKREIVSPAHDNVSVPIIDKRTAQVLSVSGNTANVMDDETYETIDLEIPDELKENLVENSKVTYWEIMGKKLIKQVRSGD